MNERQKWLKSLVPGEKVAVSRRTFTGGTPSDVTTMSVTENLDGRVVIGENIFDVAGRNTLMGVLEPMDERTVESIKKAGAMVGLKSFLNLHYFTDIPLLEVMEYQDSATVEAVLKLLKIPAVPAQDCGPVSTVPEAAPETTETAPAAEKEDDDLRCPHCKTVIPFSVFETATMNVEAYGSASFRLRCPACRGVFRISMTRSVDIRYDSIKAMPEDTETDL